MPVPAGPSTSIAITTLAAVKAHLNMTGTSQDDELQTYMEAVTPVVERAIGKVPSPRTVTDVFRLGRHTTDRVALRSVPVISLTSIANVDGLYSWSATGFHLDSDGILTAKLGTWPLWGNVEITYLAGYQTVPANYALAAAMMVAHFWRDQRGDRGTARLGGQSAADASVTLSERGIPQEVYELLGPALPGLA